MNKIENEVTVYTTLGILEAAVHGGSAHNSEMAKQVLNGAFDREIRALILYRNLGIHEAKFDPVQYVILLQAPWVTEKLDAVKTLVTDAVSARAEQAKSEQAVLRNRLASLVSADWKTRQQPHTLGTVAEIAASTGLSKSEVRRLKAKGGTALQDRISELKAQPQ